MGWIGIILVWAIIIVAFYKLATWLIPLKTQYYCPRCGGGLVQRLRTAWFCGRCVHTFLVDDKVDKAVFSQKPS